MDNNFEFLLASCIHDMKNSLSLILNSIDHLNTDCQKDTQKHLANLNYEASRLNNDLIHLLGVYRIDQAHLSVVVDEHEIWEVVNDQFLKNQPLLEKHNIELVIHGDEDQTGYFDPDLIASIINNIIVNTVRYTRSKIAINIKQDDSYLCVEICDDGDGYPENMMANPGEASDNLDFRYGSTKLGLYFAAQIAKLHKNSDKEGYISLENGGELGGGIFRIFIP